MEQETKTIETPIAKKEIKIKAYLTGREKLAMAQIKGKDQIKLLEMIIVETSVDEILDLHGKDFDFVQNEIVKVIEGSTMIFSKKKEDK